ncbi:MAG: hypothetical protein KAU06_04770 [Candidatus Marinimicrobia bacterium]|nr:hypothetical protein [Candidatus Neomarinimicrobiota bacterium]
MTATKEKDKIMTLDDVEKKIQEQIEFCTRKGWLHAQQQLQCVLDGLREDRPSLEAGMNKPIKVSIYSSKGRSTGKHNFSIEGIFISNKNSIEEAKAEAVSQFKALGHTVEFVKD